MQMHLFVLMIVINGQTVSDDMYFKDIHRCNFFVDAIVNGMRKTNRHDPWIVTGKQIGASALSILLLYHLSVFTTSPNELKHCISIILQISPIQH